MPFRKSLMSKLPAQFKPTVYRSVWIRSLFLIKLQAFMFLVFRLAEHFVKETKKYLHELHKNITFKSKIEENGGMSSLDVQTSLDNNKYTTSV